MALSLGAEIPPLTSPTPSPTPTVAQLVPLQESSQALVGTLLIVTLQSPISEGNVSPAETETASTTSLSLPFAAPVAVGQGVLAQGQDKGASEVGDEPPAEREETTAGVEVPAAWKRFILRTDQSLERFDREHPELSPDRRDEAPKTNPTQGNGAIPASIREDTSPRQGQSARGRRRSEVIDKAIESLHDHDWHDHDWQTGDRGDTSDRVGAAEPPRPPDAILVPLHPLRNSDQAGPFSPHEARPRIDYSVSLALAATVAGAVCFRAPNRRDDVRHRFATAFARLRSHALAGPGSLPALSSSQTRP